MTPKEFELFVKNDFETRLRNEFGVNIPVRHLQKLKSPDNTIHEVDLYYEFEIGGFKYLNIVECKYWNKMVTREAVMTLKIRRDDLRAHKAIMVTNMGYQSGAVEFAQIHGIGLIKLTEADEEIWHHYDGGLEDTRQIILADPGPEPYNKEKTVLKGIFYLTDEHYAKHLVKAFGGPLLLYMKGFDDGTVDVDDPNIIVPFEIVEAAKKVKDDWYHECRVIESAGLGFKLDTDNLSRVISMEFNILKMLIGKGA